MKRFFSIILALLVLPIALLALPKVAVLDMTAQKEVDQSLISPVTETIMGQIVASRSYTVLDRAYIDEVLKEKEFQLSGLVSDQQVVQAGQYLGADYVVAGKVLAVSGAYFLVVKMIEVKTGIITAQASDQVEGKALEVIGMARRVGATLAAGGSVSAVSGNGTSPGATKTGTPPVGAVPTWRRIKACFVEGDSGLAGGVPYTLEAARRDLQERYGSWLDTVAAPNVWTDTFPSTVERLVGGEGCSVVFTMYMDARVVREAALKYPAVLFVATDSGQEGRPANIRNYGADESATYYLQGMMAGALSKTGKLGFVALWDDPLWHRVVDYFALGARATNPKAVVYLRAGNSWDPDKAAIDARALLDQGCDVFAPPVDYLKVLDLFRSAAGSGKYVLSFGAQIPREAYPGLLVSGAVTDWSQVFERILVPLHEGREVPSDTYLGFRDGISRFDGPRQSIDPKFADILRGRKVKTPDFGELNTLELVTRRADQMRRGEFEPFSGPIKDQKGQLRLAAGEKPSDWRFFNGLDWLVDNVKGDFPKR